MKVEAVGCTDTVVLLYLHDITPHKTVILILDGRTLVTPNDRLKN
jgi:hypothetical protein